MQRVPGPFYRYIVLENPKILKYKGMLFPLVFEAQDRTHFSTGEQQDLHLGVGKDLVGTHAALESIFVLGLILLTFGGNTPAMQGDDLSFVTEPKRKCRTLPPFRPQNPACDTPMSNDLTVVLDSGFLIVQYDHCVYIVSIFFLPFLAQPAQPLSP